MTSKVRPSILRTLLRTSRQPLPRRIPTTNITPLRALYPSANTPLHRPRTFTTSSTRSIDILPDADKPAHDVREAEPHEVLTQATPLTENEYAEKADKYFDELVSTLEQMQEQKGELDVEYSVSQYKSSCSLLRYMDKRDTTREVGMRRDEMELNKVEALPVRPDLTEINT